MSRRNRYQGRSGQPRRVSTRRPFLEILEPRRVFDAAPVEDLEAPWQNPDNPVDVNRDGLLSPVDYLVAQAKYAEMGEWHLPDLAPGETPENFYDVDGDGWLRDNDLSLLTQALDLPYPIVQMETRITDEDGDRLDMINVGDVFWVEVSVVDLREDPQGVFAAYADLHFDPGRVEIITELQFDASFPNGRSGTVETPGLLNEFGAFSTEIMDKRAERTLARVPFRAIEAGPLVLMLDGADDPVIHDVLLNGIDEAVPQPRVSYVGVASWASHGFQNPELKYDVNGDGVVAPGDALIVINLINSVGPGQLSQNGLAANVPAGTFCDVNGDGYLAAMDVLQVVNHIHRQALDKQGLGDDLVDDTYLVPAEKASQLFVLANDLLIATLAPREEGVFSYLSQPEHGTVVDNQDGTLGYTPNADFVGEDSFEYGFSPTGERAVVRLTVVPEIPLLPGEGEADVTRHVFWPRLQ